MDLVRKVEVVNYDPNWLHIFAEEENNLNKVLPGYLSKIYHIGSTAIPNMPAKAIIDILLELDNLDSIEEIKNELSKLGYIEFNRHVIPHRSYFARQNKNGIGFHLHLRERGDPQIKRHVNFRDYLIENKDVAEQYADLKRKLCKMFEYDMKNYVLGKDKFIQSVDAKAKKFNQEIKKFTPANTGRNIKFWQQDKIIKAIEANFNVDVTYYPQYIDEVELIRIPGYTVINSKLPDDTFNLILEADFKIDDQILIQIEQPINIFKKSNLPFSWWVCPLDKPSNLGQYLEQLGTVKFGRNTSVKYPESFEIPNLEQITSILELAQDHGVNTLDTAPAYGDSEHKLGLIFKQQKNNNISRDKWVIITKAGEEYINNQSYYNFSANYINNSINNSLKNLNTEYIDILLIHSDGSDYDIAEDDNLWQILEMRKQMGDIRAYGVSSKTVNGGFACLKRSDIAMVTYRQDYLNEQELLEYALKHNKGILLKKVLNSGHLVDQNQSVIDELQFCANHKAVTSMIIGTINPEHLINNIKCLED